MKGSLFSRLRSRVRHGLLLQEMLDQLAQRGFWILPYIVYREDPSAPDGDYALPEHYVIRELSMGDITDLETMPGHDVPPGTYRRRFDDGDLAVGVFDAARLVSFTWVSTGRFRSLRGGPPLRELEADEAFVYDAYTDASYRGRGLVPASRDCLRQALVKRGRFRIYSGSTMFNRPARRMRLKVGSIEVQRRLSICLFGRLHRDYALGPRAVEDR